MEYDWRIYSKKADFKALGEKLGVDPVVARVIRNRDVPAEGGMEKFLFGGLSDLPDPRLLGGTEKGAELLQEKIRAGKKIRVVSDYDVDGVTSCYILVDSLRRLGGNVDFDIPHRIRDGYGINPRMVDQAAKDGVDTIITCDNGITALPAAKRAEEKGITFIITDHHEVLEELPPAAVMIDPHLPGDPSPYKEICGAVVAWKLMLVLAEKMGDPIPVERYLEFLAAATVCDVMPLLDENRILVREGLRKLEGTDNVGLMALLSATGLTGRVLSTYHLGFVIGPCINAMGRLSDAKRAAELLFMEDPAEAAERAAEMKALNDSRKSMTEAGVARAEKELEGDDSDVLVVYVPELHESLAGIVAGRLKEDRWKPVIVLTDSEDPEVYKGSARSIEGYHIFQELTRVKELMVQFGGHPSAAGLTIRKENVEALRKGLNENAVFTPEMRRPRLFIDVPMPMDYVYLKLAQQLEGLGPFGTGNEKPVFAERNIRVLDARIYGKNKNVMALRVQSTSGKVHEITVFAIESLLNDIKRWFTEEECDKMVKGIPSRVRLDVAYHVEVNEYNAQRRVRFLLKTCRPVFSEGGEG